MMWHFNCWFTRTLKAILCLNFRNLPLVLVIGLFFSLMTFTIFHFCCP